MSRKRKVKTQPRTMRMNEHTNGMLSVSVQLHRGRVTEKVFGPMTNNGEMALELFRSGINAHKKGSDLVV